MKTSSPLLLSRILVFVVALSFGVTPARAQIVSDATLDASPQVFAVVAAASLGGLNPWVEQRGLPVQAAELWGHLRLLPADTLAPVRAYVAQHRHGTIRQDLSRYLSLALVLSAPPDFEFLLAPHDLPPDVKEIADFRPLVKRFYAEANLRALWLRYLPAYEAAIARLQRDVAQALLQTRAYLRLADETTLGRRYVVFLEPLVPPGLTSARNYADNYYLVLNPAQSDPIHDIRHQYLHFLLDPFARKYAFDISEKAGLLEVARRAPRLPDPYRDDFFLLATECLIQAIEFRLEQTPEAPTATRLKELEEEGFILTRYFVGALKRFEHIEPSLRLYFPELIAPLDPISERTRLEQVRFAPTEEQPAAPEPLVAPGPEPQLAEAERQLAQGNHERARLLFERALSEYNAEEPRALYGLALIASLQRDAERAHALFERTARVARDPHILAWTYVYLGRLYDLAGKREEALTSYRAALALTGIPQKAQEAARRGLEAPYRPMLRDMQP